MPFCNNTNVYFYFKGIQEAKMHFYRISDSQKKKKKMSFAVHLQNEFYIINACIIYQFVL